MKNNFNKQKRPLCFQKSSPIPVPMTQHTNITLGKTAEDELIRKMPPFELSYESISHRKVFSKQNSCRNEYLEIAIPYGKKYCMWFTFHKSNDVCYLLEFDKNRFIYRVEVVKHFAFPHFFSLGTIIYGTMIQDTNIFIIEDIFYYKGVSTRELYYGQKLGCLENLLTEHEKCGAIQTRKYVFSLPYMREWNSCGGGDGGDNREIGYSVHHFEIKKINENVRYYNICAYQCVQCQKPASKPNSPKHRPTENPPQLFSDNVEVGDEINMVAYKPPEESPLKFVIQTKYPQYRFPAVFWVMADIQFDIYHLYAKHQYTGKQTYYDVAYIPNIKTSFFMNGIFRKIRENKNIDYIEESDDEDDFENTEEDKYVDLTKTVMMECSFHTKFRRWVPLRVIPENGTKTEEVVFIQKLGTLV